MKILAREFQLQNEPSESLVGTNREIPFDAMISRRPNSEINFVKWTCTHDGVDCLGSLADVSILNQFVTFSKEGRYELQSEVSINDVTKSSLTKVEVDAKVIPHMQMKYFPSQPINVMKPTEIVMTVLNLIPKCVAYWNVVAGGEFADFKEGIDGNFTNMGFVVIKDFEEYFLQELVDYDNNTLSKDVTLSIPPGALIPDATYKFRLTATCPEPVTEATKDERKNATSFSDIIVTTIAPPEALSLVVEPSNGVPMKQIFKFSTGTAKDSPANFPLKYSFGYIVDNFTVIIGTFYENTVALTQLPFANSIETFFEVCDNNGACARVAGPTVASNLAYKYNSEELEFKMGEFDATLRRAEYKKSLNTAVAFLLTQRNSIGDAANFEAEMLSMMQLELQRLKSSNGDGFVYQQKVVEFVKMSKNVMSMLSIPDETFVDDLLSLTDTINRTSARMRRTTFSQKRAAKVVNHDTDYIKNVLSLSEILLTSTNATIVEREKGKFVAKVRQFVASLCQDQNLSKHVIASNFAEVEISKVFSPQLSAESQRMPGVDASILFAANANYPQKYLCLGKIRYTMDMFTTGAVEAASPVCETILLDEDIYRTFRPIPVNELSESFVVEIPADPSDFTTTCLILRAESWSSDECTKMKTNATNRISCKCKTSGSEGIVMKLVLAFVPISLIKFPFILELAKWCRSRCRPQQSVQLTSKVKQRISLLHQLARPKRLM